jgi:hypothetical protein
MNNSLVFEIYIIHSPKNFQSYSQIILILKNA